MPGRIRLFVVAADPLVRVALAQRLAGEPDVEVVGEAAPDDVRTELRAVPAEVVLWDVPSAEAELPDSAPRGTIVVALVSTSAEGRASLAAGAAGVVRRDGDAERLVAAARAALAGLTVLDPQVDGLAGPWAEAAAEPLTPREREVLQLLAAGLTNHAIAARLGITEHTAKFHVHSILGKLGAATRTEAIVQAARLGLVLL